MERALKTWRLRVPDNGEHTGHPVLQMIVNDCAWMGSIAELKEGLIADVTSDTELQQTNKRMFSANAIVSAVAWVEMEYDRLME